MTWQKECMPVAGMPASAAMVLLACSLRGRQLLMFHVTTHHTVCCHMWAHLLGSLRIQGQKLLSGCKCGRVRPSMADQQGNGGSIDHSELWAKV